MPVVNRTPELADCRDKWTFDAQYISADYDGDNGDRDVVDMLNSWGEDDYHKVDFVDMSKVA